MGVGKGSNGGSSSCKGNEGELDIAAVRISKYLVSLRGRTILKLDFGVGFSENPT